MCQIKCKKLNDNARIPSYGTDFAAGADLYSMLDSDSITILPGEQFLVHTGISLEIPEGYAGFIFARSGLATKKGLAPANKVGVIDSDYRGEILVPIFNHSAKPQTVENNERIAQIVFLRYMKADFVQSEHLEETLRAEGGFGSTGNK